MKKLIASILFFIFSLMPLHTFAAGPEKTSGLSEDGIKEIAAKAVGEAESALPDILKSIDGVPEKAFEEMAKTLSGKVRRDNTLLARLPVLKFVDGEAVFSVEESSNRDDRNGQFLSLGLYRRDIPRLGFIVADLYSEYLFHQRALKNRVDFICERVLDDPDKLLELLEAVESDSECIKYFAGINKQKSFFERISSLWARDPKKLQDLKKYLKNRYASSLFSKEMLKPMALKFIEQELVPQLANKKSLSEMERPEYANTYEKDKDGNLKDVDHFVISIVPLLKLIPCWGFYINSSFDGGILENLTRAFAGLSAGMSGLGLQKMLMTKVADKATGGKFSEKLSQAESILKKCPVFGEALARGAANPQVYLFIYRVAVFLWGVKIFNNIHSDYWVNYVIRNREELKNVLREYKSKPEVVEEADKAKESVIDFVRKAHNFKKNAKQPFGDLYTWMISKKSAESFMPRVAMIGIYMVYVYFYVKFLMFLLGN